MAAPTLLAIMQGIETRLQTIAGLNTNATSPGQVTSPAAVVDIPSIPNYHATFGRAKWEIEATVTILVSAANDSAGIKALLSYAEHSATNSVAAAIEADKTLGGIVDFCIVDRYRRLGLEEVGLIGYYGGVFDLRIVAPGT